MLSKGHSGPQNGVQGAEVKVLESKTAECMVWCVGLRLLGVESDALRRRT